MNALRGRLVHQRLRFVLAFGGVGESASATAALTSRLAWAVAWPRKVPATRFAVLSHMLMKGFFFNQGLAIWLLWSLPLSEAQSRSPLPRIR